MQQDHDTIPSDTEQIPPASALRELYDSLGVSTPLALSNAFTELDQAAMRSGAYDYSDDESEVNKLKNRLTAVDPALLTDEETKWRNEILWLWHHHAASYALFGHQDREAAQHFAEAALSYQAKDHPNKLTRLLDLLARDNIESAREHIATIPRDSVEYESALSAVEMYTKLIMRPDAQR